MMGARTLSTRDPSAAIGRPVEELDTPALVLDLDILDANIARTAEIAQNAGARLRPHIKTHRMLAVAQRQIDAGAQGICCAKTGEAEVFADGGIDDVFIANQVVGAAKMRRLRALAEQVRLAVGVDHSEQIKLLSQAFRGADPLDLSIEIDVGQRRTGVVEPHEAVRSGPTGARRARPGPSVASTPTKATTMPPKTTRIWP